MSAGKHTPGPWKVGPLANYGRDEFGNASYGHPVHFGSAGQRIADSVYSTADANLIAAAPDLLEALEMMILFNRPMKGNAVALHNAYEAIAKATGSAK